MKQLADLIICKAQALGYRYDVDEFPSGAMMIDVFDAAPGGEMLVFQIEEDRIGISIVGDEPDLTTVPDETFFTVTQAVARVEQIMG